MNVKKKPIIDEKKFDVNPFLEELRIPVVDRQDAKSYVSDAEGMLLPKHFLMESERSVRVYISSMRRKVINDLSPTTCKLLLWMQQELDYNKDFVWVNRDRFLSETKMSLNTLKKGMIELEEALFIKESSIRDVYWINPYFLFFGNRVNKYPSKIVVERVFNKTE